MQFIAHVYRIFEFWRISTYFGGDILDHLFNVFWVGVDVNTSITRVQEDFAIVLQFPTKYILIYYLTMVLWLYIAQINFDFLLLPSIVVFESLIRTPRR